jgi:peptide/nickel transport system substrate-binding protein
MLEDQLVLSRRETLKLLGGGIAGSALLAACAPGGDAARDGGLAEFHGGTDYLLPPVGHFNYLLGVPDSILGDIFYTDLFLTPPAMYRWKEKKWEPMLAESWKLDPEAKTFTLTLKKGHTWSDGKPITSKDVVSTYWCNRALRNTAWSYLTNVEAKDEQTTVFTMGEASTVLERYILRQRILSDAHYGTFADEVKKFFDAGSDLDGKEGSALVQKLQKFRPDEAIVSGPFTFDYKGLTDAQVTFVKNEKGYAADKVAFDKVIVHNGETPVISPLVLAKKIDYATHGFPVATEKAMVKKGYRIIRPPVYSGPALLFNLGKLPEFSDVNVRRAFAHAVNRKQNGEVSLGRSGVGVDMMAGFSDNLVKDWLSEADIARLQRYEYDRAKATQLLQQAGWKKQGGGWVKPDGKPAAYSLVFPAEFADWSAAGKDLASQLSEFGVNVTPKGVTATQQPIDVDKGNFELAIQAWGASDHPHPHFAFTQALFTHNIPIAKNQGGKGMGFELKQKTEAFGELDLEKVVIDAGAGLDEATQKKNVTTAAIAFNELLPLLPLFERYGNNPALEGVRVDKWPPDSDPLLQNAPYADNFTVMLMYEGKLKPKQA